MFHIELRIKQIRVEELIAINYISVYPISALKNKIKTKTKITDLLYFFKALSHMISVITIRPSIAATLHQIVTGNLQQVYMCLLQTT